MRKVAHLQVAVVVKAVWNIFNKSNGLYLQVNTILAIYKSRYYRIYALSGIQTWVLSGTDSLLEFENTGVVHCMCLNKYKF